MSKTSIKLVHEADYAAEIPVTLVDEPGGWSPYLSPEDAAKLDSVRKALREGNVAAAAKHGRVFRLLAVSAWAASPSKRAREHKAAE
ncbi:MAG: hypothetical protein J0I26_00580 [Alphaproteobacteria bacterium]|jgi:hypothetical protein|nr:hypothetical protein [Alphaproteobacteria bacterium]OJU56287.1 MAG: hypothetical protein BGO00_04795 [Alphaproteobacteria bacterium 62-8]MBN9569410.1 hypothetical protein [Alphaproteobacteria bacterium]MBN9570500.1 hypothetical protein [Alphaproteobacteria bacterium]MBN9578682.1 hypothetical protein [Alphaproteobacteria bacterium]